MRWKRSKEKAEKAREVNGGANVNLDGGVGERALGEERAVEDEGTF